MNFHKHFILSIFVFVSFFLLTSIAFGSDITATITANPSYVPINGTSTISWTSTNADSCNLTQWPGYITGSGTSGSVSTGPITSTTVYTIDCTRNGTSFVTYTNVYVINLTCSSQANPSTISSGQSSAISWTSTNADFCNSGGHGIGTSGPIAPTTFTVSPTATTTYPISCTLNAETTSFCSGTYVVPGGTCGGYQVEGSRNGEQIPGPDEGRACSSFDTQDLCTPPFPPNDSWYHHGCTWATSNTTASCSDFTNQTACSAHSTSPDTCIWHSDTVPSMTVNCDATVTVPPPPTIDLTFAECTSYPCNALVGGSKAGIVLHPNTTSCNLTSVPSLPSGPWDCQTATVFTNPFTFNTGPFPLPGDYVFTAHGTYAGTSDGIITKTIHVTSTAQPDLIASSPPQNTATLGVLRTFFSTITNQGGAATDYQGTTSFANLFQTATGFDDAYAPINLTDFPAGNNNMTTILAGGAKSATKLISFSTLGTSWVRACADKSSATNTGTINESIEYNNCSAWGPVTVLAVDKPDLIASSPAPMDSTPIVPGVAKTFRSTITNQGTIATNYQGISSFTNLFQTATGISDPNNPVGLENHPVAGMTTILIDGTKTTSHAFTFPSVGTYYMRACADKSNQNDGSGAINESNEGNNCSTPWSTIVVGSSALPDLTAGDVTPTTATVGSSTTFSSVISNIGTASTGIGFHNFVQVSTDGITGIDLPSTSMGALGAGAVSIMSKSYTFTSAGTYYVRVCADKSNRSDLGVITESNENNNCSKPTTITVKSSSLPDLIAGATTPSVVSIKGTFNFSATITNQGDTSTVDSFMNLFQIADKIDSNGNGSNVIDIKPATLLKPYLGSNSSQTVQSESYSFDQTGTKYVRACADKDSMGDLGTITESNEDNNCGPWTSLNIVDGVVDGACTNPQLHYTCSAGFSANNGENKTDYTWNCTGLNGGKDASCSEIIGGDVCPVGTSGTPPKCICDNGANDPPTCTSADLGCLNGATNPPTCDNFGGGTCSNGATNYPLCTTNPPDTCLNGATNPPTCDNFGGGTGTCSDTIKNGNETGIDCGGRCLPDKVCKKIPKWWEL